MSKTIDTLVEDIYEVIKGKGGWDAALTEHLSKRISGTVEHLLEEKQKERTPGLRMSNLGTACERRLWYELNPGVAQGEPLEDSLHLMFMYGHILEDLILTLAEAAGHTVEGEQDESDILGIKGHRDCVIDGVLLDVKSASPAGYSKFQEGKLKEDDPFGYIEQLSSYLYAAQEDPLVKDKKRAGFLAINKSNGKMVLDMYDLTDEMEGKEVFVQYLKDMVVQKDVPKRTFEPVKHTLHGTNMRLDFYCSMCPFKKVCHEGLRTFEDSKGRQYHFTTIVKEPRMKEVTHSKSS